MALVLVGAGLLLVRGGRLLSRLSAMRRPALARFATALPMASAFVVAGAGLLVVARSAVAV